MVLLKKFQAIYPSFNGPISAEESVRMQLNVIRNITIKDSGKFLSHFGNREWL